MQSPFKRTVYMDIDCQVNALIDELFSGKYTFGIVEDFKNQFSIGARPVNTGVIVYSHGNELIEKWAKDINYNSNFHRSDQEILQVILDKNPSYEVNYLPVTFNWVRMRGYNPAAAICHWTGPEGKSLIKKQIQAYDLISN